MLNLTSNKTIRQKKLLKKLVAIFVILILLFSLSGCAAKSYPVFYFQGKNMFYVGENGESWQVTDDFFKQEKAYAYDYSSADFDQARYITITPDGKGIFYVSVDNEGKNTDTISYRPFLQSDKAATEIDTDIFFFKLNENCNIATYLKSRQEKKLYSHNLTEKTHVADGVEAFFVSPDGKKIAFLNDENQLYLKELGKENQVLCENVQKLISFDGKQVSYITDGRYLTTTLNKSEKEIDKNVCDVLKVYPSGEAYYIKDNTQIVNMSDFVDDKYLESDKGLVKPTAPEFPQKKDYKPEAAYRLALEEYYTKQVEYQQKLEEYYKKETRDGYRSLMNGKTVTIEQYSLYYYDGKKSVLLTDDMDDDSIMEKGEFSENKAIAFVRVFTNPTKKVELSEAKSFYDIQKAAENAHIKASKNMVAIKGDASVLEQSKALKVVFDQTGKELYFSAKTETEQTDLYKVSLGKKVKKVETYDTNIFDYYLEMAGDSIVYRKNVVKYTGDLYIDKVKVDAGIKVNSVNCSKELKLCTYCVENADDTTTLKLWENGKVTTLAENCHSNEIMPNGSIIYIKNFDVSTQQGELYLYKGGKETRLSDSVASIVPLYSAEKFRD